jgi:hypothetical protein
MKFAGFQMLRTATPRLRVAEGVRVMAHAYPIRGNGRATERVTMNGKQLRVQMIGMGVDGTGSGQTGRPPGRQSCATRKDRAVRPASTWRYSALGSRWSQRTPPRSAIREVQHPFAPTRTTGPRRPRDPQVFRALAVLSHCIHSAGIRGESGSRFPRSAVGREAQCPMRSRLPMAGCPRRPIECALPWPSSARHAVTVRLSDSHSDSDSDTDTDSADLLLNEAPADSATPLPPPVWSISGPSPCPVFSAGCRRVSVASALACFPLRSCSAPAYSPGPAGFQRYGLGLSSVPAQGHSRTPAGNAPKSSPFSRRTDSPCLSACGDEAPTGTAALDGGTPLQF